MIIQRRQRLRYRMNWNDRELIGDAEVKFYEVFVDVKPAKHNTRPDKELVSIGALAAGPLRVIESEFRPEIVQEVVLQGQAGKEGVADVTPLVRWERIANRSLEVEIPPAPTA